MNSTLSQQGRLALYTRLGIPAPRLPGAPDPMPPVKDDPDRLTALQIKQAYTDTVKALRFRNDISDIDRARRITQAYTQMCRDLATLANHFIARIRDRVEWLSEGVPVGPGIDPDTTPADRAVLMTSFNNALERVRNSKAHITSHAQGPAGTSDVMSRGRAQMLADAERFDDDITRRAVLTTYVDESRWDLIEAWAKTQSPNAVRELHEWLDLNKILEGTHFDGAWIAQGFGQPTPPDEARQLPGLVAAHNATVDEYNHSYDVRTGRRSRREPIVLTADEIL